MLNPALISKMNIEDYKEEEPNFETHFRDFLQRKENGKFLQDKDTCKIFSVKEKACPCFRKCKTKIPTVL